MPPKDKSKVKPLSILFELTEANAARYWRILPWEFDQLTSDQRGKLVAVYVVNREIEHYYHKEQMRDVDKSGRDNRRMVKPKGQS